MLLCCSNLLLVLNIAQIPFSAGFPDMTSPTASVTVEEKVILFGKKLENLHLDQKYPKQEDYFENVGIMKFHVH